MTPEAARTLGHYFAGLMEQESKTTARVIAALPDSGRDYRPDERSRTAWELATHLATGDVWFLDCILKGSFQMDPEAEKRQHAAFASVKDVVDFYTREYPQRIAALRAMSDADLARVVDFFGMMQQPNATYLGIANNHGIHHRGQLAAYLRAVGGKVPSIYGGSADEPITGGN